MGCDGLPGEWIDDTMSRQGRGGPRSLRKHALCAVSNTKKDENQLSTFPSIEPHLNRIKLLGSFRSVHSKGPQLIVRQR